MAQQAGLYNSLLMLGAGGAGASASIPMHMHAASNIRHVAPAIPMRRGLAVCAAGPSDSSRSNESLKPCPRQSGPAAPKPVVKPQQDSNIGKVQAGRAAGGQGQGGSAVTRPGHSATKPHMQQQQQQSRPPGRNIGHTSKSQQEDVYDDEDEAEAEAEDGELITDAEEVERLVFGGKDFTKDTSSQPSKGKGAGGDQSRADGLAACRTALGLDMPSGSSSGVAGIPPDLAELALAAAEAGLAPSDPTALTASLSRLVARAAEGDGGISALAAVQQLAGWLGEGVTGEEVLAGALKAPRVLCLSEQEVKERVPELIKLLNVLPARVPRLLAAHPELLVAPAAQIAAKLRALKVTTGLEGEAAVALMTPHMMGGM